MNKTFRSLTIVFLAFTLTTFTAYGTYTLWSTVVTVNVIDYSLTLSASTNGLTVTLNGTLTDPDNNPVNGATITLYQVDNMAGNNPVYLNNKTTNINGDYLYIFIETSGDHYYRASYEVT